MIKLSNKIIFWYASQHDFQKGDWRPNLIKEWSITELEQLKSLSLKIQETTSKSVAITEKLVTLRNK